MKKIFGLMITLLVILLAACQPETNQPSGVVFKTLPSFTVYQNDEDIDFMEGVIIESLDGENLNYLVTVDLRDFSSTYIGSSVIYYQIEYQGKVYEKYHLIQIIARPVIPGDDVYYMVSFNSNGGSSVSSMEILEGTSINQAPQSTRVGYTFDGWFSDGNLTTLFTFGEDVIEAPTTLHAKWILEEVFHTVSFVTNGGTSIDSIQVLQGSAINQQIESQRQYFIFDGWYSDENFRTLFNLDEDVIESNLTLYAKWIDETIIDEEEIELNIFYLNDLHGAVLPDVASIGLANIANLIMDEKENNPENTIFITGGDMLQGQVISNYYTGASVIDLFNQMELDAFVMGNHEFDWGLDKVLQYFNGENNLQANFPLLAANVYSQETDQMIDDVEPYTMIERSGLKIAIIGTVGYGLESSIAYPRVQPYYFYNPIELTGYYAEQARLEGANIVLAVNHKDDSNFNDSISRLTGNRKVDVIFNGHTHQPYVESATYDNRLIHTIQSGANGSHVGQVSLTYHTVSKKVDSVAMNLTTQNESRLTSPHPTIQASIDTYVEGVYSLLYDSYMTAGQNISKGTLATYIASLMQKRFNVDVGIHNSGGTRTDIKYNEELTYSKLFQISPFDNKVIVATIKGSVLKSNLSRYSVSYRDGFSYNSINDNQYYTIATNDYIFYDKYSPFKNGTNINITEVLVLDLFVEVVENLKAADHTVFYINLPIIFNDTQQKQYMVIPTKYTYQFA